MGLEVSEIEVNGQKVRVCEMSWAQAEKYVEEGNKMLARTDVAPGEWTERTIGTVLSAINAAKPDVLCTADQLKAEFGIRGIRKILDRVLEISGLRETEGEAKAA
jgi:hypothetical protein